MPEKADLSNCHLEFLPENVFINTALEILILRHNALRERPIEEDIYTIGWLEDLPRFSCLRVLNLADNQLHSFPSSLCQMKSLVDLNLSSNKFDEIPTEISELVNLKILHLHNNCLSSIPEEIAQMKSLCHIVLSFNQFTQIPPILLQSKLAPFLVDSIIMAGNQISRLPAEQLIHMTRIKKIDLRLNQLQLMPTETAKFQSLEHVTHLDIRENQITDLDIRAIKCLEYLNCDHNTMRSMQLNGSQLKNVFAAHNSLQILSINPKPEYLASLNISQLFTDAKRLKIVRANHNRLTELPDKIRSDTLEELHLQHNQIRHLSTELFIKAHRLRYLNVTKNKLIDLPAPNKNDSYNKLQELYLSFNHLGNQCLHKICCFPRLRVLHLAKNKLSVIEEIDIEKLEQLAELNVSSNNLTYLPSAVGRHPKLQVLRANCNLLRELPNFKSSSGLKVLEVSSNHLIKVNMENLMSSHITVLDITANPTIQVKTRDIEIAKTSKKLCMVDVRGQNVPAEDTGSQSDLANGQLWRSGLSQTSGIRNKLSVSTINKPHLNDNGEALFAIFDGGRNDIVASQLCDIIPAVLKEERSKSKKPEVYLKYSLLSAHRNLKHLGQKLGAAAVVAHIHKDDKGNFILSVANVGDAEVVLCRHKKWMLLSRPFLVAEDVEDTQRVVKTGGIITEDGRVSGVTYNTRLLGCSYLYPHVIPEPHVSSTLLTNEDSLCIVASQGLWQYVTYEEAVLEIKDTPDPVVAAKRLQDLAQGYGARENIAVLVVRLMFSETERARITDLMRIQRKSQKELLKALNQPKDILHYRDGVPRSEELNGVIIDKSGHAKRHRTGRKQLLDSDTVQTSSTPEEVHDRSVSHDVGDVITTTATNDPHGHISHSNSSTGTPSSERRLYRKKSHGGSHQRKESQTIAEQIIPRNPASNVDLEDEDPYVILDTSSLQRNATDSSNSGHSLMKDVESSHLPHHAEAIYINPYDGLNDDPYSHLFDNEDFSVSPTESITSIDTTIDQEIEDIYKSRHEIMLSKNEVNTLKNSQNDANPDHEFFTRPLSPDSLISQDEFVKPLVSMTNIDRDALLFHHMQLARAQAHAGSLASLDSIQSAPLHASKHDVHRNSRTSSHSIEVLVNIGDNQDSITGGRVEWGSSLSGFNSGRQSANSSKIVNVDSCSETLSFSMDNFADSSHQTIRVKEAGSSDIGGLDKEDADDADTLVGEDEDIGNLNDVMSDEEIQMNGANTHSYGGMDDQLTQVAERHDTSDWSTEISEDQVSVDDDGSDSDESIGNLSLGDGYSALEFPMSQKKESLSMLNIVDIEKERYFHNFSKLKHVSKHGKSIVLEMQPRKNPLYSSDNSQRKSKAIDIPNNSTVLDRTDAKSRSFMNLTYADIGQFHANQNVTVSRPETDVGEEDMAAVYAVVNKVSIKKDKKRRAPESYELEDNSPPIVHPFVPNPDEKVDSETVSPHHMGKKQYMPTASSHHSPGSGEKHADKSPHLAAVPVSQDRYPSSRTSPTYKRISPNVLSEISTDAVTSKTHTDNLNDPANTVANILDPSEVSHPGNRTNPTTTQESLMPPPLPPRPSHFKQMDSSMSDVAVVTTAEKTSPLMMIRPPPLPPRRNQTPSPKATQRPVAMPRRSLSKKNLNSESEIDNSVLSAQALYPNVLHSVSTSSFPSSIDVSNTTSKLSHQRSIIITYL
ncbi:PH domain leucine-rich repeat-containing protein phosphatase 2 [Bulinus truncatus]|nr:PH domain leucine-rich repeat-containing protein phosphatase 2 [Bulinus truncatus]